MVIDDAINNNNNKIIIRVKFKKKSKTEDGSNLAEITAVSITKISS